MAERKFYWIKLKKDFMSSDAVDFLMSQKNGAEYVVLYQMLCLMTVKTNGKLERQLNEVIIPYDAEKIQRDTKYFNINTVRNALQLYIHLGLIYKDDNGCLSIADYENLVGSESGSAERMRRLRNLKASQCDELSDTNVTKLLQKSDELSDTDIEIDKEIDKDKDINRLFIDKNPKDIRSSSNEEKEQLMLDENNAYTVKKMTLLQLCDEYVDEPSTQVRLGKDRLGKDRIEKNIGDAVAPHTQVETINQNENSDAVAHKKTKKFVKPTIEEIEAFAHELNLKNLDAQYFYDYYESNGWMVGKNHMKDWKATAKNWNRRQFNTSRQKVNVVKMPDYMREQVDAKTFGDLEKEGKCPF